MRKRIEVSEQFLRDTYEYLIKYAKEHPKNMDVLILVGYAYAALHPMVISRKRKTPSRSMVGR